MFSFNCSAVFSRPLVRLFVISLVLTTAGAFAKTSAQVQNTAALFALTSARMPTQLNPKFATPVARLVGTTLHVDTPRPFRARVVFLESVPAPTAPVSAPLKADASHAVVMDASASPQEQRAMQLINQVRASKGLKALVFDPILSRAARMQSESMATNNYFNHVGPDGKTASDRIRTCGIHGWKALGENIAYNKGYDDPVASAVEKWMASPMHRDNMLNPMWSTSAIGIATSEDGRIFFTELFLAR
jgi:uncharacterized protein YkwD